MHAFQLKMFEAASQDSDNTMVRHVKIRIEDSSKGRGFVVVILIRIVGYPCTRVTLSHPPMRGGRRGPLRNAETSAHWLKGHGGVMHSFVFDEEHPWMSSKFV